jgi:hypothetical protein
MNKHSIADKVEWQSYGTHFGRFEPPDVLIFRAVGSIGVEDTRRFLDDVLKWPRPERGFFYLSDMTQMTSQSSQVVGELRKLPTGLFRATAGVGAKFHQRVAADILLRVIRRLRMPGHEVDVQFFATEAEARVWFDSLRASG